MDKYEVKRRETIKTFEGVLRVIGLISELEKNDKDYNSIIDDTSLSYISYDSINMFLSLLDNNELLQMEKSFINYGNKNDRKSLFTIFLNLNNNKLMQLNFSIGKKTNKKIVEIEDKYIGQNMYESNMLDCQINSVIGRSNREGFKLEYLDYNECVIRFVGHQVCVGDTNDYYYNSFKPFFDYRKYDGKKIFDILNPINSKLLYERAQIEATDLNDEIEVLYSPEYEEELPKVNKLK